MTYLTLQYFFAKMGVTLYLGLYGTFYSNKIKGDQSKKEKLYKIRVTRPFFGNQLSH
jgi:hypothetical protein